MKIPGKEIFKDNRVLLIGYSSQKDAFSRLVAREFEHAGMDVVAYNPTSRVYDRVVFQDFDEIHYMPEVGVALLNETRLGDSIEAIASTGIRRLILNRKSAATEKVHETCRNKGITLDVCCPLLIVGSGIHRIHQFFARIF